MGINKARLFGSISYLLLSLFFGYWSLGIIAGSSFFISISFS